MKALKFVAALLILGSEAVGADTSYQGPDGGDITDPANWKGAAPQYDATTNPDTTLYFSKKSPAPGETYGVTMSQDLTAYSMKLHTQEYQQTTAGLGLEVDLDGHALQLISGMTFGSLNARTWSPLYDGNHVRFHDGTLNLLGSDGTSRKTFTFANDSNVSIGRNSSLVLDNVTGLGDFNCQATNVVIVITNGTKWAGSYTSTDGHHFSKTVVTGKGTVLNLKASVLQTNGRFNAHANNVHSNEFIITDHAAVTNGYRVWVTGVGGIMKVLDASYLQCSDYIRYEGYGEGTLFLLAGGSRLDCGYADFARAGRNQTIEIAGKGTVLACNQVPASNAAWTFGGYGTVRDNKLWVHDGAIVTNKSPNSTANFGCATAHRTQVVVEGGSSFYMTSDIGFGTDGGTRYDVRVDTDSWMSGHRIRLGLANAAQTNTLFVGSGALLTSRDWIELRGGEANELTVSNGTLKAAGNYLSVGSGWSVTLAGRKPRVEGSAGLGLSGANCSLTFDIPAEGYDPDQAVLYKSNAGSKWDLGGLPVPTFKMDKFRMVGGTLTLAEGALGLTISDAKLAAWQEAANAAADGCAKCELEIVGKKLVLTCTPKKGMMILLR